MLSEGSPAVRGDQKEFFGMPLIAPPALVVPAPPLSEKGIRAALAYAKAQGGQSLLIEEGGALRFQHYADPALASQPQSIMSGAKNLWTLAVLQLVDDGRLDLEDHVSRYLPSWSKDPLKAKITLRHLLSCTSGLWAATRELHGVEVSDKLTYAQALPVEWPAGEKFLYAPSHYEVLGAILRQVLGPEDPVAFLHRRLLQPMGLQVDNWRRDGVGQPTYFAGASLTPSDWMKVGRLLLAQGEVDGKALVPKAKLAKAFHRSAANGAYGLSFWLNHEAARHGAIEAEVEVWIRDHPETRDWRRACLSRHAPSDLVACIGSLGQRLYVVPSRHLVIVHMGRCARFKDATFLRLLFQS